MNSFSRRNIFEKTLCACLGRFLREINITHIFNTQTILQKLKDFEMYFKRKSFLFDPYAGLDKSRTCTGADLEILKKVGVGGRSMSATTAGRRKIF